VIHAIRSERGRKLEIGRSGPEVRLLLSNSPPVKQSSMFTSDTEAPAAVWQPSTLGETLDSLGGDSNDEWLTGADQNYGWFDCVKPSKQCYICPVPVSCGLWAIRLLIVGSNIE
jgi:hypothetical protein